MGSGESRSATERTGVGWEFKEGEGLREGLPNFRAGAEGPGGAGQADSVISGLPRGEGGPGTWSCRLLFEGPGG